MKLSNHNAKSLLLHIHQDIEEYADFAVTKLLQENDYTFLNYPPNCGLTEDEITELRKLENNAIFKNALRKVIADSSAGVIFNMLNLFDATSSAKNDTGDWTGVKIIDEEPNDDVEEVDDALHDKFFETYWDWREIRENKNWKLDIYDA